MYVESSQQKMRKLFFSEVGSGWLNAIWRFKVEIIRTGVDMIALPDLSE
jgi:hypothetical protein